MPLPRDYASQVCSLARALEIVGERWTLLIVRDAFYGVRRFGDFATHLGIPRAVLSERLTLLTDAGVLQRVDGQHGRAEYALTDKGLALWPVLRDLGAWGDQHYAAAGGPRRVFRHVDDQGSIGGDGVCAGCGAVVAVQDVEVAPGPGLNSSALEAGRSDSVTAALASPHRLLAPVHP